MLFLDFDGVLHPYTQGSLCMLPALEAVLRARPEVGVVVSSNWRMSHSLAELRALFSDDIASRVLDALPFEGPEREGDRQRLIERWLAQNPTRGWCALDDDARLFSPSCPWLVLTERGVGLTGIELEELARRVDDSSRHTGALRTSEG